MEQYEKRGYLLENFRIFHLRTLGETGVDYHYHEFCKLLFLVEGQGSYVIDGNRYLLQSGDLVLVDSRRVHCPELEPGQPYERIILYIAPEFLAQQSTPDCDLTECFSQTPVLRLNESHRQKLFSLVAKVEKHLGGEEYGRELASRAALLRLLVEIGRALRRAEATPVVVHSDRVLALMRYMDAHLTEDLDTQHLAERFYISKYHMMRLFHRETGFTIHTYLLRRRLLHARELIQSGMRATEASYRSGFRSYSTFTRAYGKYFGMTPTGRQDTTWVREEGFE